jgi:hypothetical protein
LMWNCGNHPQFNCCLNRLRHVNIHFVAIEHGIPRFSTGSRLYLKLTLEPTTVKSLLLPHAHQQRGLGQDCPFLTSSSKLERKRSFLSCCEGRDTPLAYPSRKARIIKRCYHLPYGLSPRPVWIFIHTLVVLCFRGSPEFGGLASHLDTRRLYCLMHMK